MRLLRLSSTIPPVALPHYGIDSLLAVHAGPPRAGSVRANAIRCSRRNIFPTRFGMDASRPWMAMRIAVIALKTPPTPE
jgi:hypothetical protein